MLNKLNIKTNFLKSVAFKKIIIIFLWSAIILTAIVLGLNT